MYLFSKSQAAYALLLPRDMHAFRPHKSILSGPRNSWRGTELNHLFLDFITFNIPQFNYKNNLFLLNMNTFFCFTTRYE